MNSPVLFTVAFPRRIEGVPLSGWFDYTDSISLAAPLAAGGRYRVYPSMSAVGPSGAVADSRLAAMAYALERPADADGRIAALATRWTVGLEDPKAKADAIVRRLRRDYSYSTYSDGRRTSLADFLFTVRRGNCEYFASAGAMLLRFAGIPTRLVTGFRADDWNEWGRFYDVRQSAAHAWVEAWIPDRGWVLYDPTPEETGLTVAADEFARRIERWAEALEASWYRRVIGYDQYSQRDAIGSLRFSRWLDGVKAALGRLPRAPAAAAAILLLVGWGALTLERIRPRHDFERAERLLARAGFRRRSWQTAREFAQEVSSQRPDLAAANALAEEHYAARWSGRGDDAAARARRERLLADIKANLFVKMPRR